jgi:hypothetical protein
MIFELHWLPEAFLQVKKLMEKTYSETEQNMSEKQGKGQIMLHLPMKFENQLLVSLIMPLLSSKSVDKKINQFVFKLAAFWR